MLILTRKVGKSIMINDNIVITVLKIGSKYIQLGIEAPKDMPVHREEIYKRIQKEKLNKSIGANL